jgi:hypothetical protein
MGIEQDFVNALILENPELANLEIDSQYWKERMDKFLAEKAADKTIYPDLATVKALSEKIAIDSSEVAAILGLAPDNGVLENTLSPDEPVEVKYKIDFNTDTSSL